MNEEFPMRDLSIKSEKAGIWKSWKVDSIRAGFHWPRKVQTKFQLPEHEIESLWSDFLKTSTWKEDSGGLIQFFFAFEMIRFGEAVTIPLEQITKPKEMILRILPEAEYCSTFTY